nr:reverse transcriptase domain-containing protein [Tanacetum cinerariifolium]
MHQAATRKREKAIVNSPQPIYDQEPSMVDDDEDTSKDKEIDKLMALISLSFKKIYKPTNNNLRTSSNTSRANQDNSLRIHRNAGYEGQRSGSVAGARETVGSSMVQKSGIQCYNCKEYGHVARECQKPKRAKDAAYHREKMLLCKKEKAGIQLNAEQADWKDDTDDESDDQELEAHYMYMAKLQQVSPDAVDSGPIFDKEPKQKIDQNDEDVDLAKERELLASLIAKLKYEIDESKNRNTLLETSNKVLVEKLKSEIADFKHKNKSLTEANSKLSVENDQLYADYKKSKQNCNNVIVLKLKEKLFAHQDTISILKQQKDAQIKLYKAREDKEIEKVIDLENKVKDDSSIVIILEGEICTSRNIVTNSRVMPSWREIVSLTFSKAGVLHVNWTILGHCTKRALIDVFEGELTLRVGKESITFNLDQTLRYSANYNDMTANRIDVIDMACEEYSQEVLNFSDVIMSGNPTPYYDPIISTSSPTLTTFEDSDFLLKEVDAFLALEDDPTSLKVDQSYFDTERDILLLEAFLNDDPSLPPPNQGNYLTQDLPPHFKYAFLEGDDKFPFIIAKDLSDEEKTALITVLKSRKRAIAWKLFDIMGINPEFCTHKILIEDDFEPAVKHQRRVNPKIHNVIKKEGGFTVVENKENELIPTRLVTGWRVTYKFPLIRKIKKRPHSCVLMECLPTVACLLGSAMHRARFKGEKSHFMVKKGIVLGHKISKNGIEVDKAKVDVIGKLPHPTTVKGIRSFLGHVVFYRRFIKYFSKIAQPMTRLLEKDTPFFFSKECVEAFQTLKRKLTEAPILIALDWDLPFELMCDASDFDIGVVLGKHQEKHFRPIHYASKTMTEA